MTRDRARLLAQRSRAVKSRSHLHSFSFRRRLALTPLGPSATMPITGFLRECFVKGIISLGEVERQIPFIHAGRERKFPVNSLLQNEICRFWAEFGDFQIKCEKFPVIFPVNWFFGLN